MDITLPHKATADGLEALHEISHLGAGTICSNCPDNNTPTGYEHIAVRTNKALWGRSVKQETAPCPPNSTMK